MTGVGAEPRVVAVVVAYNREALLAQTLDGLAAQIEPPAAVVVVDNASTDGSFQLASSHKVGAQVVRLPANTGGAGGFTAGIAYALNRANADYVWLMDDDTVPSPAALLELLRAASAYRGTPAVLASRADWHDGREHPMNRPRERAGVSRELRAHAFAVGARQIRSASFVSVLIDARAIREVGLPVADYFLWNDDFEYTARLLRGRVGLYVPASRVTHLTKVFGSSDADPGERFFNEVRNKVWLFTRSDALGAVDRTLYAGATVRRWARMLARSDDRGTLMAHGRRGLRAGFSAPRPNAEVLAGTPVAGDVAAVEAGFVGAAGLGDAGAEHD